MSGLITPSSSGGFTVALELAQIEDPGRAARLAQLLFGLSTDRIVAASTGVPS